MIPLGAVAYPSCTPDDENAELRSFRLKWKKKKLKVDGLEKQSDADTRSKRSSWFSTATVDSVTTTAESTLSLASATQEAIQLAKHSTPKKVSRFLSKRLFDNNKQSQLVSAHTLGSTKVAQLVPRATPQSSRTDSEQTPTKSSLKPIESDKSTPKASPPIDPPAATPTPPRRRSSSQSTIRPVSKQASSSRTTTPTPANFDSSFAVSSNKQSPSPYLYSLYPNSRASVSPSPRRPQSRFSLVSTPPPFLPLPKAPEQHEVVRQSSPSPRNSIDSTSSLTSVEEYELWQIAHACSFRSDSSTATVRPVSDISPTSQKALISGGREGREVWDPTLFDINLTQRYYRNVITMSRPTPDHSRSSTLDSATSAPSPTQLYRNQFNGGTGTYLSSVNSSQSSLHHQGVDGEHDPLSAHSGLSRAPPSAILSAGPSPAVGLQSISGNDRGQPATNLSGLVCNVHRTTGREPHSLVGATTTVLGDKLYVFGGRRISRTRPQLTSDIYELDLPKRHWTKLEAKGDIPPPRYFHSMCPLGDTKLVCYGGMSPLGSVPGIQQQAAPETQPEVEVMSDIHIFDVPTCTWMNIPTTNSPQGRYAHCAAILPSSGIFSSPNAPLSAIQHNPSSGAPNQGQLGVQLDGSGGAEMVVVGGQDGSNHYIEQISVFNLRSLKWTSTDALGRSCGSYRSVVAPLSSLRPSQIGMGMRRTPEAELEEQRNAASAGSSLLIYSNFNFLDVKLELQVRMPDGTLSEKPMRGSNSPPGLRFPNGGVINNHFVISGTFLTSSKQEYALWALDLRTLEWSRIDAGGNVFSQGSWNRGVIWQRKNMFVILGNRKRSLVDDYNHRRINFSNICLVELEAFGLYDNPRRTSPLSGYVSVSAPEVVDKSSVFAGGRQLSKAAEELGQSAIGLRELADMDFLAIGGERVPVNSHMIARRWGVYFNQLLKESTANVDGTDTATLRPTLHTHPSRNSSVTITPSISGTTITNNSGPSNASNASASTAVDAPDARSMQPSSRPRTLYLPHTQDTIQALVHYLYTSSLPPPNSGLATPQILCSLLQIAIPYHIDGLEEAVIERLHQVLDGRNTAAIFNAAAMAAGGGKAVAFVGVNEQNGTSTHQAHKATNSTSEGGAVHGLRNLRINTDIANGRRPLASQPNSAHPSDTDEGSVSASESASELSGGRADETEVWTGELSAVVGLQKRGLRGLMEGRRLRERGRSEGGPAADKVGLGIV